MGKTKFFNLAFFISFFMVLSPNFLFSINANSNVEILLDKLSKTSKNEATQIRNEIWNIWLSHRKSSIGNLTRQAMDYFSSGELSEAEKAFSNLIAMDPSFVEGWNKRATVRYMQGDLKGSLDDIREVLVRQPRHFGAMSGKGMILFQQKKYEDALFVYSDLLKVDPHNDFGAIMYKKITKILGDFV